MLVVVGFFEQRVFLQQPLDFGVELQRRQLEQPDRLLQLRRQRQVLAELELERRFHRNPALGDIDPAPRAAVAAQRRRPNDRCCRAETGTVRPPALRQGRVAGRDPRLPGTIVVMAKGGNALPDRPS
jgi:hypothetical protein